MVRNTSLLLPALLLTACGTEPASPLSDGLDTVRAITKTDAMPIVCDERFVIATTPSCDSLPSDGWDAHALFPTGPGVLDQYCVYEGTAASDLATLESSLPPTAKIGVDCRAVGPQGDAIRDEIGDELDTYFGWLAGRLEAGDIEAAYGPQDTDPVEVAVVDTFPETLGLGLDPHSDHGPMVMSVVETIACPDATCKVSVNSYLGLPRLDGVSAPDTDQGGVVGRQSDLAKGIVDAVEGNASSGSKLVINLSVGWESELFGGTNPTDMPPPVKAVYDALRYARCQGALIIVAAGNTAGLTENEVPLAPARWEGIAAPTAAECSMLGLSSGAVPVDYANAPLVHAVGGMFGPLSEMPTSREFGMPRLSAAASHAVVPPREGLPEAVVRTGSSVAAAVASGAASLVWSLDSSLSPAQVMDTLYDSGMPTGLVSDFGGPSGDVHRINACFAVDEVIGTGSNPLGCGGPAPVTINDLVTELWPVANPIIAPAFTQTELCGDTLFHQVAGQSRPCDDIEDDPWAWLVSPQPPKSGCYDCVLTTTTTKPTAILTVDEEFDSDTLVAVGLEITEEDGDIHRYSLTEEDLVEGTIVADLRSGEIDRFEVPLDLGGVKPLRSMVYLTFASGERTEDVMLVD